MIHGVAVFEKVVSWICTLSFSSGISGSRCPAGTCSISDGAADDVLQCLAGHVLFDPSSPGHRDTRSIFRIVDAPDELIEEVFVALGDPDRKLSARVQPGNAELGGNDSTSGSHPFYYLEIATGARS
jgi:hypothetical protein